MPERRTAKDQRQHLYLAFDDWVSGYTIRKVRLTPGSFKGAEQTLSPVSGSGSGSGEGEGKGAEQPLPGVFMRIETPRRSAIHFASAFGTKIVALHPGASDMGIPMLDVKDQSCIFVREAGYPAYPAFFPELPYPPFWRYEISSYAVQPDGCILISAKKEDTAATTTFIFDTKEYVWKPYGDWALPFTGRGHYDPSLDAFVGLSKDPPETLGYLYSCSMDSAGTGNRLHPTPLICVSIDDVRADQELKEPGKAGGVPQSGRFMYRLKILSLRYDKNGELKVKHCWVRCYSLPHETTADFILQDPAAFWL
ncbi:uncharacterized protein C2845_PM11G27530 [Panicum miliaceum]|uniref:Uncharacterized protein n=1 Tax=Panicum miliaceum TaxID=4540 RepID=A0A3L6RUA0_PANMI|nr:uncharacterized protein C2845_PM11G27530 [Panicum miliaceum]